MKKKQDKKILTKVYKDNIGLYTKPSTNDGCTKMVPCGMLFLGIVYLAIDFIYDLECENVIKYMPGEEIDKTGYSEGFVQANKYRYKGAYYYIDDWVTDYVKKCEKCCAVTYYYGDGGIGEGNLTIYNIDFRATQFSHQDEFPQRFTSIAFSADGGPELVILENGEGLIDYTFYLEKSYKVILDLTGVGIGGVVIMEGGVEKTDEWTSSIGGTHWEKTFAEGEQVPNIDVVFQNAYHVTLRNIKIGQTGNTQMVETIINDDLSISNMYSGESIFPTVSYFNTENVVKIKLNGEEGLLAGHNHIILENDIDKTSEWIYDSLSGGYYIKTFSGVVPSDIKILYVNYDRINITVKPTLAPSERGIEMPSFGFFDNVQASAQPYVFINWGEGGSEVLLSTTQSHTYSSSTDKDVVVYAPRDPEQYMLVHGYGKDFWSLNLLPQTVKRIYFVEFSNFPAGGGSYGDRLTDAQVEQIFGAIDGSTPLGLEQIIMSYYNPANLTVAALAYKASLEGKGVTFEFNNIP